MSQKVYALCEPDTGEVRYVGRTGMTMNKRLNGHYSLGPCSPWLRDLRSRKLRPRVEIIATVASLDRASRIERMSIKRHKSPTLLNRSGFVDRDELWDFRLRISSELKNRIQAAARADMVSMNTWIMRAMASALEKLKREAT